MAPPLQNTIKNVKNLLSSDKCNILKKKILPNASENSWVIIEFLKIIYKNQNKMKITFNVSVCFCLNIFRNRCFSKERNSFFGKIRLSTSWAHTLTNQHRSNRIDTFFTATGSWYFVHGHCNQHLEHQNWHHTG